MSTESWASCCKPETPLDHLPSYMAWCIAYQHSIMGKDLHATPTWDTDLGRATHLIKQNGWRMKLYLPKSCQRSSWDHQDTFRNLSEPLLACCSGSLKVNFLCISYLWSYVFIAVPNPYITFYNERNVKVVHTFIENWGFVPTFKSYSAKFFSLFFISNVNLWEEGCFFVACVFQIS